MAKFSEFSDQFKGKAGFLIGLFGLIIYSSSINLITPVLADIDAAFPGVGMTAVQMVVSIPALMAIPMEFLTGILVTYIRKKRIVQFSLVMVTIGGILPLVIHDSFEVLLASSVLIGMGGFNMTLSASLVAMNFDGPARSFMFGINGSVQNIAMTVLVLVAGIIGTHGYWNAWWVFVPAALCLVVVTIFFPLDDLEPKVIGKGAGQSLKGIFTPGLVFLCVLTFVSAAAQFSYLNNSSFFIMGMGGDAAVAGAVNSVVNVARIVIGLAFGVILAALGKWTLPVGYIVAIIAFALLIFANNMTMVYISGFLYGVCYGFQVYGGFEYVSETVDRKSATMAISLFLTCTAVGVSFSPVIVNGIASLTGAVNDPVANLTVAAGIYVVVAVAMFIREAFFHKNSRIGQKFEEEAVEAAE